MKFFILSLIFLFSCVDKNFIIYSIDGEKLSSDVYDSEKDNFNKFNLYFSKDEIQNEYYKVNIIATDYFHYGQFFFDKNFMKILESRTLNIGADALIFEKNRTDFPNYDDNYLYFTAIKYKN